MPVGQVLMGPRSDPSEARNAQTASRAASHGQLSAGHRPMPCQKGGPARWRRMSTFESPNLAERAGRAVHRRESPAELVLDADVWSISGGAGGATVAGEASRHGDQPTFWSVALELDVQPRPT